MNTIESKIKIILLRVLFAAGLILGNVFIGFTQDSIHIQNYPFARFQTLTTDDGLTHNYILDIEQDRYNYLWIATLNGLNRYDGQKIKNYQHDPNKSHSIPQGAVTCLEEDSNGTLWVGTENGLCIYNEKTDQFRKITLNFGEDEQNHIRAILNEGDSLLWIEVCSGYLLKYDKRKEKVLKYWKHKSVWQSYYYYHDIYRDKRGLLWFGGRGFYPSYLDEVADKIITISTGSKPGLKIENDVSCYFEDSDGNFWIAGLDGAYNYNPSTRFFTKFISTSTFSIIQAENTFVWFGTGNGIYKYDLESKKMFHYTADINSSTTLPNNHINKLYKDKQGAIWIGTDDGLSIYRTSNDYINYFNHIPGNDLSASSDFVSASWADENGNIWVGYRDHGIDLYNPSSGFIKHYRASKGNAGALASDNISCFYEDAFGDLYIGLWDGIGFARKKKNKEEFELFTYLPNSRNVDWYNDFAEDDKGNFYIGFWGADGLSIFDRKNRAFGRLLKDKFESAFESRLITRLLTDRNNKVWMGTTKSGLHIYDPEKDTSRWFYDQEEIKTSFKGLTIYDIYEDKKGRIWVAADSLFRFNTETESFQVWGKGKGLTSNSVYKILEDEVGNLWLGTESGIICFNPEWDYCLSFPDLAGIEMSEYLGAASKLSDGRLLFGGKTGWVIFDPKIIFQKQKLPDIFLTELSVKGELKLANLAGFFQINLLYDENFFSVGFANTDLTASSKYSYRYRLSDVENNWTYIEKGDLLARYTNIQPGNYVLEIQMALNNSNWKDIKAKSIAISIRSPFWKRYWFIISVIAIFLAITFTISRGLYLRITTKRKMAELKELLLRAQINPHFIFNSLTAIQGYIYKKEEKEAGRYLAEFSKLIRLILENTKEEYITLEKEIELLNYYLSLQKQRFKTKFAYKIEIDPNIDLSLIKIPPMLAQPFVENAIEHGVIKKLTNGEIHISLNMFNNTIVYTIEDNGIGRTKSNELKKGNENHKSYGTEITEERINCLRKKYGSQISYQIEDLYNEKNQATGTRVTIKIPVNIN